MVADANLVVIGAGAVGLASAYASAASGLEVVVLDSNSRAGSGVSSRSSEVVHAGIYYLPGSMKATLCRQGASLLKDFCKNSGVPFLRCGKLIVATSDDDLGTLALLKGNAAANGVSDIRMLSRKDVAILEPELDCQSALLSPATAVFDSSAYIQALQGALEAFNAQIIFRAEVIGLSRAASGLFSVETHSAGVRSKISCQRLVLCGGLSATKLGSMLDYPKAYTPPQTYFAKGHYFSLSRPAPFEHLIYPVPSQGGLGIHFTRDCHGGSKFGPDITWVDTDDMLFDGQEKRAVQFRSEIQKYWPGIEGTQLSADYVGVRPKLTRPGEPPADFAVHTEAQHGIANLIACYGLDSPGLTASLAIGQYVTTALMKGETSGAGA
jgi:L-2-hydroxyglutarate oxidase LhgO